MELVLKIELQQSLIVVHFREIEILFTINILYKKQALFGYGIGNWRIYSIEADSKQMASYIVPYFAHNDFLEVFVERVF